MGATIVIVFVVIALGWWVVRKSNKKQNEDPCAPWRGLVDKPLVRRTIEEARSHAEYIKLTYKFASTAESESNEFSREHHREFAANLATNGVGSIDIVPISESLEILSTIISKAHCLCLPFSASDTEINFARRLITEPNKIILYRRSISGESAHIAENEGELRRIKEIFESGIRNGYFWLIYLPSEDKSLIILSIDDNSSLLIRTIPVEDKDMRQLDYAFGILDPSIDNIERIKIAVAG